MARDAVEVVVRGVLMAGWNPANTSGVTPAIHLGWLNTENNTPEITVSNPDVNAIDGGDTGYSGMTNDGTPIRTMNGTVMVDAWADRTRTSENPRRLVHEFQEEVSRIIDNNAQAPSSADLQFLSFVGSQRIMEDERDPVMARYTMRVRFGYRTD